MIAAVDVGGTKIAVGLVTTTGEIIARQEFPTLAESAFETDMQVIADILQSQLAETGTVLQGVGIGCTGQVDPYSGKVLRNAFLPNWAGQSPVEWLSARFHVGTALENDADAGALAEWQWGTGQKVERFIYITISTGIGGGVILNGQVYRGADGVHPEIGHHTIDPNGPACFCGNTGCWETLASGRALQRRMESRQPGFSGDARLVCDMAESHNPIAVDVIEAHARAIGIGLANLIVVFAPQVITLGGGLMRRANLFWDGIRAEIQQRCRLVSPQHTRIELSHFGASTGLVGAAQAWRHRYG
jgi:glucokinase